jgi:hypothetical protein
MGVVVFSLGCEKRSVSPIIGTAAGQLTDVDSVLSIYFNYAELYTSSPSFLASATVWTDLSQTHDGYTQLERARDAAFALIQALCSPEIGRTLV